MRDSFCAKLWLTAHAVLLLTACTTTVRAPVSIPIEERSRPVYAPAAKPTPGQGFHVVAQGDTLYSIAWRYGIDYKEVAAWNGIRPPYLIYPGQVIRLKSSSGVVTMRQPKPSERQQENAARKTIAPSVRQTPPSSRSRTAGEVTWRWPSEGKLVRLDLPTSDKGLNISGMLGQEIHAAAAGEVVYSGSGLLGYGKLIIIKHNDTYLSAYAHNDRILIEEGMQVTIGQQIATMGIGKNGKPLLHFEIRKNGKPVDPMRYLPPRNS